MNKEEIEQRFKKVSESVESLSKQQEMEIVSKVDSIQINATKKLSGLL